ncbi:MBL fold metallo-hydrolase [Selenomonas ruminantium]|uniref:Glyoxylase, beta-lactamase superfamily II n=1 Tax=Selenomonas ruminantium TaxID=971 RepID=A0A1I0V4X2_SELRU|nr:MBL fold metallo-hydrolase [Selenomonas ruminantium]SFA70606.1 Glyoxylase, beta-lactamase superfamily II [Selenomonas ruminantium]
MTNKFSTDHPQVPGFFRLKVGKIEITALCDGLGTFAPESFRSENSSVSVDELKNLLDKDFTPRTVAGEAILAINAFLVNTGEQLILIDAGKGNLEGGIFLEKEGLLVPSLRAAGFSPEDIEIILPTHLHNDHINGLEANGRSVFPDATLYIAEPEKNYWLDSEIAELPKEIHLAATLARSAVKPYVDAERVKTFRLGEEVFPHIKSVPVYGHTPGHTGYLISSDNDSLFIWGDLLHIKGIQLIHPEISSIFDSDQKGAIKTREEMLPKLAARKQLIAGSHLPFPGIGHIDKQDGKYLFHPVEYQVFR